MLGQSVCHLCNVARTRLFLQLRHSIYLRRRLLPISDKSISKTPPVYEVPQNETSTFCRQRFGELRASSFPSGRCTWWLAPMSRSPGIRCWWRTWESRLCLYRRIRCLHDETVTSPSDLSFLRTTKKSRPQLGRTDHGYRHTSPPRAYLWPSISQKVTYIQIHDWVLLFGQKACREARALRYLISYVSKFTAPTSFDSDYTTKGMPCSRAFVLEAGYLIGIAVQRIFGYSRSGPARRSDAQIGHSQLHLF